MPKTKDIIHPINKRLDEARIFAAQEVMTCCKRGDCRRANQTIADELELLRHLNTLKKQEK